MPAGYIILKIDSFSAKKKLHGQLTKTLRNFLKFFCKPKFNWKLIFGQKKASVTKKKFCMVELPKHLQIFLKLVVIFLSLLRKF